MVYTKTVIENFVKLIHFCYVHTRVSARSDTQKKKKKTKNKNLLNKNGTERPPAMAISTIIITQQMFGEHMVINY